VRGVSIGAGMGKLAFVFPGQGSQRVGMGSELRESDSEICARYYRLAEEASGLEIDRLTLEGPPETLTRTDVAQPALFALSLAVAYVAREMRIRPDFVAGHSLGEYTAAVAVGTLPVEDGTRLVVERGRAMAAIQSERPGAMAAVIGLEGAVLTRLCEQASEEGKVTVANLNSPTQIVVSGEEAGVERLIELAKDAGAKRALRLQVGAAFHSELMKPVQEQLDSRMRALPWSDPEVPLAANFSGRLARDKDEVRAALVAQIASPVRWVDCVRTLVDAGCTTFLELGPGRVLSGLVKQIEPEVDSVAADSRSKLAEFAQSNTQFVAAERSPHPAGGSQL
jgi:[acyl-carrier-protein] S-malonyltransferase